MGFLNLKKKFLERLFENVSVMCLCCYIVYNEQCNIRISFQCLWIIHPCVFWFFGSIPSWCVFSGLCVHWNGNHLCSLRILLHFSLFKKGAFCHHGNNLWHSTILYKKLWKNPICYLKMFWPSYFDLTGIFIKNFYALHFYIFFALIFYFVKDIWEKNKQYFLYCHYLLLFLFSSQ